MRVLLDANILISYLLSPNEQSPVYRVVSAGLEGGFVILLPEELLQELARRVPEKEYLAERITGQELQEFADLFTDLSENIPKIDETIPAVIRDPKDDYLLAYAVVGEADYLVTGDADLLDLEQVGSLRIITAREFLTILEAST